MARAPRRVERAAGEIDRLLAGDELPHAVGREDGEAVVGRELPLGHRRLGDHTDRRPIACRTTATSRTPACPSPATRFAVVHLGLCGAAGARRRDARARDQPFLLVGARACGRCPLGGFEVPAGAAVETRRSSRRRRGSATTRGRRPARCMPRSRARGAPRRIRPEAASTADERRTFCCRKAQRSLATSTGRRCRAAPRRPPAGRSRGRQPGGRSGRPSNTQNGRAPGRRRHASPATRAVVRTPAWSQPVRLTEARP